jgi:hypothetical protein
MTLSILVWMLLAIVALAACSAFAFQSLREGERRAAGIAFGAAAVVSLACLLVVLLPGWLQAAALVVVAAVAVVGAVLFILPVRRPERGNDVPTVRIDERDIMFSRGRLEPGSPNYEAYYATRPENQAGDDKTRLLPGLLSPRSSAFHPLVFASTDASFGLTEALRDAVDGPVAVERAEADAASMTGFVKDLARYYGALAVGVAELRPYHFYSHVGRGTGQYGAPITPDHRYGIAFAVEMDLALVGTAPYAPTVMESARQYVEAARVAVQLANFVRLLGYPARAHIDGNYRVVAPLVARDAGLGEIGRMGLLMTPALGPRVRLGVATTDLPRTAVAAIPLSLTFAASARNVPTVVPLTPFRRATGRRSMARCAGVSMMRSAIATGTQLEPTAPAVWPSAPTRTRTRQCTTWCVGPSGVLARPAG